MNIKIGEIIKKLRKEKNITQETLSQYLNISYQAVSKWENGSAFPDINILPALANFFSVTIDTLFGMNDEIQQEEIKKILEKNQKYLSDGNLEDSEHLIREALAYYPNSFQLISALANVLYTRHIGEDFSETSKKFIDEIISKEEFILQECNIDELRYSAIELLTYCYNWVGYTDKAIEMAKRFPCFINSDDLLAFVYTGNDKIKQEQLIIINSLQKINSALETLSAEYKISKRYDDALYYLETANKLIETLFENKEILFFHKNLELNYVFMSRIAACQGKDEQAVEYLEQAVEHVKAIDSLPSKAYYTSRCFNLHEYDSSQITPYSNVSAALSLWKWLSQDSNFDGLRNKPEFISIMGNLKQTSR